MPADHALCSVGFWPASQLLLFNVCVGLHADTYVHYEKSQPWLRMTSALIQVSPLMQDIMCAFIQNMEIIRFVS